MASKSANINVNINSNFQQTAKSSEDMRKRIRELRKEFYSLEEGTEEYNKVLSELSKLQLDYTDQTIVMRNSANDLGQRLTNLVKVSGDLMSGFSAVQGVMGLLGVESDGFERTLIKLQSAIAIVQGLEGLEGMIDHMKALRASFAGITKPVQSFITAIGNWIKFGKTSVATTRAQAAANTTLASTTAAATTATTALSGAMAVLRTALISTGIGALVVAIGAAVAAMVNWISTTNKAKDAADAFGASVDTMLESLNNENTELQTLDNEYKKITGTYDELAEATDKVSKADEKRATIMRTLVEAQDRLSRESNKKARESLQETITQLKDALKEANDEVSVAYAERRNIEAQSQKDSLEQQQEYLKRLKGQFDQIFGNVTKDNPIIAVAELINSYYRDLDTITKSVNAGIITESRASTAIVEAQWQYSMYMVQSIMQLSKLIGLNGPAGVSMQQFNEAWNLVITQIGSFSSVANNPDLFEQLIKGMDKAAATAEKTATSIEEVAAPDLSDVRAENRSFNFVDYILGRDTMDNSTKEFNKGLKDFRDKQAEENRQAHEEELRQLEDLNSRRIELMQQYASLYSDTMSSLLSENDYLPEWLNDMNSAFSALSGTLTDIQGQFANFFNEETGEIDFSMMKWEDWTSTAVMGLNGVSDILGSYASSYKDQMQQVLESDEATDAQKQEAVKRYKDMMYAQTAIDMLSGMTAAVATAFQLGPIAGPIVGAINAAMVLASGIASLTQIKAIDPLSENSVSGAGGASVPNVSDVAINTDAYSNQLTAQSSYDLQGALDERSSDTRVYVLESDIAETSKDVNTKVNESTF